MVLVILLTLFFQTSEFLKKDELRLVRKGVTFELTARGVHYNFTYDIWKDKYFFYNKDDNKSFSNPDSGIIYIKEKFKLKSITIQEKEKEKKKKRSIILFDFVSDLIADKKRVIIFEKD